jgi:hypothetical protein
MHCQRTAKDRPPTKLAQTFFAIDADTQHPVCFTMGTAARTLTQATPELLDLAARILNPQPHATLVLMAWAKLVGQIAQAYGK